MSVPGDPPQPWHLGSPVAVGRFCIYSAQNHNAGSREKQRLPPGPRGRTTPKAPPASCALSEELALGPESPGAVVPEKEGDREGEGEKPRSPRQLPGPFPAWTPSQRAAGEISAHITLALAEEAPTPGEGRWPAGKEYKQSAWKAQAASPGHLTPSIPTSSTPSLPVPNPGPWKWAETSSSREDAQPCEPRRGEEGGAGGIGHCPVRPL